jgi:mannose-6-phosphate isomerase-like protein (cupin superfamily)
MNQTTRDENARVVDIGDGWSMELGIIHRAKQRVMTVGEARAQAAAGRGNAPTTARGNAPTAARGAAAAEQRAPCGEQVANPPDDALQGAITHDFQTEGYYIVSGSGTAFIDGKLLNGRRSTNNPDGGPNGPGCGGGVAVGSRKVELKVGDVLIVPPGVIHGWFDIPDHVDYLSFRPSHGIMKNGWVNPTIAPK